MEESLADIIKSNIEAEPLLKLFKEKGVEAALKKQGVEYQKFLEHMELFKADEFSWEKLDSNLGPLRELTQFDHFTASKVDEKTQESSQHYLPWAFYNPKIFTTAIPLSIIAEYCKRPNYMFGTPIYDGALRLQCDLL